MSLEFITKRYQSKKQNLVYNKLKEHSKRLPLQLYLNSYKPIQRYTQTTEEMLSELVKQEVEADHKQIQDVEKVLSFLSHIRIFSQYTLINSIEPEVLYSALSNGEYVCLKPGELLFRQGEHSNIFYLILSGKISFRLKNKKKDDKTGIEEEFEKEVTIFNQGQFFGEWGLIYNIRRTLSTYSIGDSILVGFNRQTFDTYFAETLLKSEIDRKVFICSHIKHFKNLNTVQFNQYYRDIKKVYLGFGEMVFQENKPADAFYLIYKGSCCVKKGKSMKNLLIRDVGDIIGIESLNKNYLYQSSVYSHSSNTILFKFLLSDYSKDFVLELKENLTMLMNQQKVIFDKCYEQHVEFENDLKEKYPSLLSNSLTKKEKIEKFSNIGTLNEIILQKEKSSNNLVKKNQRLLKGVIQIKNFDLEVNTNANNDKINLNLTDPKEKIEKNNKNLPQIHTQPNQKPTINNITYSSMFLEHKEYKPITLWKNKDVKIKQFNFFGLDNTREKIKSNLAKQFSNLYILPNSSSTNDNTPNIIQGIFLKNRIAKHNNKKRINDSSRSLTSKINNSVNSWRKILNNKKEAFLTKRYNIPLIGIQ